MTLVAGIALVPERVPLLAAALLVGFGLWTAVSIAWSPLPSLARDDALLSLLLRGRVPDAAPDAADAGRPPARSRRSPSSRSALLAVVTALRGARRRRSARRLHGGPPRLPGLVLERSRGALPRRRLARDRALGRPAARGRAPRAVARAARRRWSPCWLMTQSKGGARRARRLRGRLPRRVARAAAGARARRGSSPSSPALGAGRAHGALPGVDAARLAGAIHHAGDVALVLTRAGSRCRCRLRRSSTGGSSCPALARAARSTGRLRVLARRRAARRRGRLLRRASTIRSDSSRHAGRRSSTYPRTTRRRATSRSLGSSRYDYWRVALLEFERHPLIGLGRPRLAGRVPPVRQDDRDSPSGRTRSSSTRSARPASSASCCCVGAGALGLAAVARAPGRAAAAGGAVRVGRLPRRPHGHRLGLVDPVRRPRRARPRRRRRVARNAARSAPRDRARRRRRRSSSSPCSASPRRGSRPASRTAPTVRARGTRRTASPGPRRSIRSPSTRCSPGGARPVSRRHPAAASSAVCLQPRRLRGALPPRARVPERAPSGRRPRAARARASPLPEDPGSAPRSAASESVVRR